ncbi:hypothetical protein RvY_03665 [Ramazzottius varieornatus]|uniref:Cysteine-rich secretory protein domain-containing protein n=1 Tax=Ramazzottius varieornatus TaxID=947166 RepID=A0A1D1UW15_RAMVA|nr:hypothetical protein RvY_03665 [Ramazzottius varieornatus]
MPSMYAIHELNHFLRTATTFQIGCAFSPCPESGPQYVCNFGPGGNNSPGNNRAQLCVNAYLPGTAANGGVCGKCPGSCDNGLCTNPCRFANIINNNDLCDRFVRARGGRCGQDVSSQSCKASCNCLDNLIY